MKLFERVRLISTELARSQSDLAKRLELTLSTFNGYLNEKRQDNLWPLLPRILEIYPQLNRDWLFFGEGEMCGTGSENPQQSPARMEEMEKRIANLEQELADERRLNRQLVTRLLVDGVGDKGVATNTSKRHD